MPNSVMEYPSRSSRNSKLYREVYGKYEDLDNLPIEDNTDEIDMERLREIVYSSDSTREYRELRDNLDVLDVKKRNIDTNRVYDINQILEKAKYENSKLKEPVVNRVKHNKNLLSTLQMETIRENNIDDREVEDSSSVEESPNIYMTREFKFKELNNKISELNANPLLDNVMDDNDLSFDLFEDLKPTGNTIITKPISDTKKEEVKECVSDMHSSDTSDIDIIKPMANVSKEKKEKDEDFFTNSYAFTSKDFSREEQDFFFEEKKSGGNLFKIILLLIAIAVFAFVIVYFVLTYGIGV